MMHRGASEAAKVELATGDRQEALDAFATFDGFEPAENYTIPPLED